MEDEIWGIGNEEAGTDCAEWEKWVGEGAWLGGGGDMGGDCGLVGVICMQ